MSERWVALGVAARLWWAGLAAVALAGVLVVAATTVTDASSHPTTRTASGSRSTSSGAGRHTGPMAGMSMGGAPTTPSTSAAAGSTQTASSACGNVEGATTMADGHVVHYANWQIAETDGPDLTRAELVPIIGGQA